MGEYAEYQLAYEMRRGRPSPKNDGVPYPKSPVGGYCPHCGKGIRTIAGKIDESMRNHIKAKHNKETP